MKAKKNLMYDKDYTVKDGRLINNAPPTQMGITKMANRKRAEKRAEKVGIIVEANNISRMLGDM
jgi:hypothetical protein|tara:strand:- start:460 stop:651 length:192 start_codon:yes stop_codon:yes gene_type:complete